MKPACAISLGCQFSVQGNEAWWHSHLKMSRRSAGEGTPISSSLSKRPGRLREESSAATRFVAAMTTTPEVPVEQIHVKLSFEPNPGVAWGCL